MQFFASLYVITLPILLVLDVIWLSLAGRTIYAAEIGGLMRESPNFFVAFLFYLLFAAGLVWFVIAPAAAQGSISRAMLTGAFFGLVAYATYDLTNLATMKGFTAKIAMIDLAWGTIVSAVVSGLALYAARLFKVI
ncbi:MAG: DUF2177 family protein [Aestuariivirga sp.]